MKRYMFARRKVGNAGGNNFGMLSEQRSQGRTAGNILRDFRAVRFHDKYAPIPTVICGNLRLLHHDLVESRDLTESGSDLQRFITKALPGCRERRSARKTIRRV